MANVTRGGFTPVRSKEARCRRYEVASGYDPGGGIPGLFSGDVVTLAAAGVVEVQTEGAGTSLILGVASHFSYVRNGVRIDAQYLPAATTYSPTARGSVNASYVWVWDDPTEEFVADLAAHANTDTAAKIYAAVGSNMDIEVATVGSTVYGRSGMCLDGNPIAGAAQMRIMEVLRSPDNDLASARAKVICMVNEGMHALNSSAGI